MTATGYKFSCVQIVDGARVAFTSYKLLPSVKEMELRMENHWLQM